MIYELAAEKYAVKISSNYTLIGIGRLKHIWKAPPLGDNLLPYILYSLNIVIVSKLSLDCFFFLSNVTATLREFRCGNVTVTLRIYHPGNKIIAMFRNGHMHL